MNLTCPNCGSRLRLDLQTTTLACPQCGYTPTTDLEATAAQVKARGPRRDVVLRQTAHLSPRAVVLFENAQDALHLGDTPAALDHLRDALDLEPDFDEAHLLLARLSDDEAVKREHLSSILARNPGHAEAMQMMLVLNGRLSADQLARAQAGEGPTLQRAAGPVEATAQSPRCPRCAGALTVLEGSGGAECRFCGWRGETPAGATGSDLLLAALLERRAEPVRWQIDQRVLHCHSCGAEHTLPGTHLNSRCPFCASAQVIVQDALGSFEQPDGLLPFVISREDAGAQIKERLRGLDERLKGWLDENRVARATLNGYYLPFWVFDAQVMVNRTRIDRANARLGTTRGSLAPAYQHTTESDGILNLSVCAVNSPPPKLIDGLGRYDLSAMRAYDPTLLTRYGAELYALDVDAAALIARSRISHIMRERHERREYNDDRDVTINVTALVQTMTYRLALLPVWIATLEERDGDLRPALVNGQTGQVALG
jgi:DNA-directed RNA polymerase subunit RPC12/RpoP/ribosomal protein L37AE/L43A